MTESERADVERRAKQDAQAQQSGWPITCPYPQVEQATEWIKQYRLALVELKK